jgi:hypothetical protein
VFEAAVVSGVSPCKIRKNAAGTAASTVNFIAAARRAAEQNDSGEQKKTSFGVDRCEARKREQRHGMIKLLSTALFQISSRP